ncbi:GntR family transcriptional regulator [Halomonas daqingensis]|uniref:GntR family transcriptional regulator n=1 Tax=Billgrantia desiderata TaxID=52021 RepID=UPI000A3A6B9F|nr:GntR family transcriptional regulator [Halomonas desiderata]MCE8031440.1 GntR family transcriptional regulator [Halomonas desiderata]OUE44115.1 GntR family transcriptional regulator [Halomonas desiderata SP1]
MLPLLAERVARHLEKSSRTPKYLCLRDALVELIEEGKLAEGSRLPTEQELAAVLPVSLGTVQKALRDLVESGELYRRRRLGTFVASGEQRRRITTPAFTFLRPEGAPVRMVLIRLLRREVLQRHGAWVEVLGDCAGGYLHLVRQDRIDGAFDCYTEIYLRGDVAGELATLPTETLEHESVLPLLMAQGHSLSTAENRISHIRLPKAVARAIAPELTEAPPPGLRLETRYQDDTGRVLAWQIMYIPPSDYRLTLTTQLKKLDT